jgi:hypothetical protein
MVNQQTYQPPKKTNILIYVLIGLAILTIGCCGIFSIVLSQVKVPQRTPDQVAEANEESQQRKNAITLRRRVREVVEKALKSPKSAEFELEDMRSQNAGDDVIYFVSGHVDSQNGFGATIRTKITSVGLNDGPGASIVRIYLDDKQIYSDKALEERLEKHLPKGQN